jgi:uncharacterized repeat protein (TIGR01451 family)
MRQYLLLLLFLFSFTAILAENDPNQWLANQKISFTENKGQIADKGKVRKDIFYVVQGKGVKVYFTKKGLIYNYIQTEETFFKKPKDKHEEDKIRKEHPEQIIRKGKAFGMELLFENASDKLIIKSEEETGETSNYYLPHCPDGVTGVKNYQKITYENIYENIDLVFYSNEQGLKYDFIVKPGGKVEDIKLRYKDIDKIKLLNNGNLEITNPLGKLTENKPFSYQNNKQEVKSNYILKGRTISFQVDNYDKTKNLIIDPSIVWSTYYGGTGFESGNTVATDKDGNVYLSGITESTANIASSGFQNTFGGIQDAFLVKFSSSGQRLWATYYGGTGYEFGFAMDLATDASGNIYLAGTTESTTGIASGGLQNTLGGSQDAFLVKFNGLGQRLWATYYGGNKSEYGYAVVTDKDGNVYLAGKAGSTTGIASGGFQNTHGGGYSDAFLIKYNADGQGLWATYYGGSNDEWASALSTDNDGNIYLAGNTYSTTGIASGGFQNTYAGNNAFLVKFNGSGQRLWATYYGGFTNAHNSFVSTDKDGNVYLAGRTISTTGIASGGFQNTFGGDADAFLVKFNSLGQRLWATYYGGSGDDIGTAIITDKDGNVYLAGDTNSSNSIASGGFQNTFGGYNDAFLVKFNSLGKRLWATYYGGRDDDRASDLSIDNDGNVYLAGTTESTTGIASGGFQNTLGGGYDDAFLGKIIDNILPNIISGNIYNDLNGNCIRDTEEKPLPNIIVKAEPDGFGISDSLGNYSIPVGVGTYIIKQALPLNTSEKKITQTCPINDYTIQFTSFGDTIKGKDFGNQGDVCPFLQTKISSNRRRRCFLNNTTVSYSNTGFLKAENVKVYVQLPEYVVLKKADKSFTKDSEGNYVFSIGSLDANQSGVINIQDSVVCKTGITGLTACTKAWITPVNNCKVPSTNWDKSDIVLSGKCIDNGRVRIVLKNTGEGNMADSSQMRLYLNASLALKKGFKINKGDSLVLSIPANGRTVRLEADQRVDHPRKASSNITFEGCVANLSEVVSKGFVNQFPQDDSEPEVSMDCQTIRDSYDPNDKIVEPEGTTANHYTPTDAELKYLIRFQNTGTDTAYTVTVIDTLSENLDIATLQLGSSSHKYSFNVSGKGKPVLTWTFNKINLPDSTKNKLGSNGFVSFSIKPKSGLAEKTKIENYADIIFDFNDPVRTNTTFNTIYDVPLTIDNAVKLDEKTVIIPKPVITSFTPSKAKIGETITLKGKYFDKTLTNNTVKINNVKVTLDSGNDSTLVFKVPSGAITGKISVENTAGSITSSTDLVIVFPPVISSFVPQTGVPGDKVSISGSNFETDKTKNTVKFGTVSAEVISSTATNIEVKVPGGFVSEKISVSTTVGDAISAASFAMSPNAVEVINSENISIFPNPTDGKVKIESKSLKISKIVVLNALGKEVLQKSGMLSGEEEIDLSGREKGLYFLVIHTSQAKIIKKLIIQ